MQGNDIMNCCSGELCGPCASCFNGDFDENLYFSRNYLFKVYVTSLLKLNIIGKKVILRKKTT